MASNMNTSQRIYQVDAFTDHIFGGNPAAVCPLEKWLPDETMQKIAMENNLAETAFYVAKGNEFELRWFTPKVEVDLCGHATLAAAYVLFNFERYEGGDTITFHSHRSGKLTVKKSGELLTLNFPVDVFEEVALYDWLTDGFNIKPKKALKGKTDYVLIYESEKQVLDLSPDFGIVGKIDARGVIATAKGTNVDFVSRFFAPQCGINEDPVTGSAHTTLTPYWAAVLGKKEMSARQISERMGVLQCKLFEDRVEISGKAKLYLRGQIMF